ncbi:hypothetical protein GCM10007972_24880 [Iodidimonas muriae]|uniref:Pentapeptide repeat-containing protein n=1 Tax=Iodidimonas muriae TaxID=261467 RepID=A0ABQ2LFW4_9PROT|nr:hypothetical protein JCM17843_26610 [Kordiimonadales bacterium JCM 17843]GGO16165.1 hypothetical protein GCM10007972_24880 [Iodidimonas muriae]
MEAQFSGKTTFEGAEFKGAAFFKNCTFPESPTDNLNIFRATRFRELASFRDVEISSFAAFNEARFSKSLILHDPGEKRAAELWKNALNAAKAEVKGEDKAREAYFGALQGGCRVLKQEMEKIADQSREHRYFRYELIARRHRTGISWAEKVASQIYGALSDYGHSIGRPLLWLGGLFLLMILGVFLIAPIEAETLGFNLTASPHPVLADSFALSWQNIFKPGAVWDARFPDTVPALAAAFHGPGLPLWLKSFSTLQSALSLLLIFLSGVAIRRKFRIS